MQFLYFDKAFIRGKWQAKVRIAIQNGIILSLEAGVPCDGAEHIHGAAIPAMANVHSHAFQRAFAGLAEYRPEGYSDFWSWRQAMYAFSSKMTPEYLEAIAAQLYLECLKSGYSHIGEFHYIHNAHNMHNADGALERQIPRKMAEALFRAADTVGIGMTFLPVHYQTAGFDEAPLSMQQKAFSLSMKHIEQLRNDMSSHAGTRHIIGHCFHSLRAVPEAYLKAVMETVQKGEPVHIHVAEQKQEVQDCLLAKGKRPVELLFDMARVDENWCLIHATHLTKAEVSMIAKSGAIAGICPTTEANLGDGVFPLADYLSQEGRIAIGSDSHVCRSPLEELRLLEYSQRLKETRRTVACNEKEPHAGTVLWSRAAIGGHRALGVTAGEIKTGARADIAVIDDMHPALVAKPMDHFFDSLVFAGAEGALKHVMVDGVWRIKSGCHTEETTITRRFIEVMQELLQ